MPGLILLSIISTIGWANSCQLRKVEEVMHQAVVENRPTQKLSGRQASALVKEAEGFVDPKQLPDASLGISKVIEETFASRRAGEYTVKMKDGRVISGRFIGVDDESHLLLKAADGTVSRIPVESAPKEIIRNMDSVRADGSRFAHQVRVFEDSQAMHHPEAPAEQKALNGRRIRIERTIVEDGEDPYQTSVTGRVEVDRNGVVRFRKDGAESSTPLDLSHDSEKKLDRIVELPDMPRDRIYGTDSEKVKALYNYGDTMKIKFDEANLDRSLEKLFRNSGANFKDSAKSISVQDTWIFRGYSSDNKMILLESRAGMIMELDANTVSSIMPLNGLSEKVIYRSF